MRIFSELYANTLNFILNFLFFQALKILEKRFKKKYSTLY